METKELIDTLRKLLPQKVLYGDLIGAEGVYAHSGPYVYEDPELYFIEMAADRLEQLTEELEKVKVKQKRIAQQERESPEPMEEAEHGTTK